MLDNYTYAIYDKGANSLVMIVDGEHNAKEIRKSFTKKTGKKHEVRTLQVLT